MSEPVSKAEIEDVLSSIRRLVSDNANVIRRETDAANGPDRLVLTPAFRVDEGEEPASQEDAPDAAAAPDVTDDPLQDAPQALPEPSDAAPLEGQEVAQAKPASIAAVEQPEVPPLSPLEQRIAELEAVVSRSAAEFEPDGSEADDMIPDNFVFHHRETDFEPEAKTPEPDSEPETQTPEPVSEADATEANAPSGDEAATELFAEDAPRVDWQPEPQAVQNWSEPVEDVRENTAEPVAVADQNDTAGAGQDDAAGAGQTFAQGDDWEEVGAAENDDDGGEAVLDEDTLREMVARMVREELQGAVGERITHNVRRMVRREIARALSLQDFD